MLPRRTKPSANVRQPKGFHEVPLISKGSKSVIGLLFLQPPCVLGVTHLCQHSPANSRSARSGKNDW